MITFDIQSKTPQLQTSYNIFIQIALNLSVALNIFSGSVDTIIIIIIIILLESGKFFLTYVIHFSPWILF